MADSKKVLDALENVLKEEEKELEKLFGKYEERRNNAFKKIRDTLKEALSEKE